MDTTKAACYISDFTLHLVSPLWQFRIIRSVDPDVANVKLMPFIARQQLNTGVKKKGTAILYQGRRNLTSSIKNASKICSFPRKSKVTDNKANSKNPAKLYTLTLYIFPKIG